jgi:hypothetical protein
LLTELADRMDPAPGTVESHTSEKWMIAAPGVTAIATTAGVANKSPSGLSW